MSGLEEDGVRDRFQSALHNVMSPRDPLLVRVTRGTWRAPTYQEMQSERSRFQSGGSAPAQALPGRRWERARPAAGALAPQELLFAHAAAATSSTPLPERSSLPRQQPSPRRAKCRGPRRPPAAPRWRRWAGRDRPLSPGPPVTAATIASPSPPLRACDATQR